MTARLAGWQEDVIDKAGRWGAKTVGRAHYDDIGIPQEWTNSLLLEVEERTADDDALTKTVRSFYASKMT